MIFNVVKYSAGEIAIKTQIANIINSFLNQEYGTTFSWKEKGTVFIFIDEFEQHLHPEWMRKYLCFLLDFFSSYQNYSKKIQIIINTHSPYLISDLPKENIILLEKDEKTGKRTVRKSNYGFASNYYDIMSDSFFLDDTIGEFAKQKINGCIQAINRISDDLDKLANDELILDDGLPLFIEDSLNIIEEQNKIIALVGDDVIKKQLCNMSAVVEERLLQLDVVTNNKERLRKKRSELAKQMAQIDQELESYD